MPRLPSTACPPPINQSGSLSVCLRSFPAGKNKMKKEPESHKQNSLPPLKRRVSRPSKKKNTKGEALSHVSCVQERSWCVCVLRPLVSPWFYRLSRGTRLEDAYLLFHLPVDALVSQWGEARRRSLTSAHRDKPLCGRQRETNPPKLHAHSQICAD